MQLDRDETYTYDTVKCFDISLSAVLSVLKPLIWHCGRMGLFTLSDRLLFDGRVLGAMRERSRDPDNFRSVRTHAHWSLRARRLRLRRLLQ